MTMMHKVQDQHRLQHTIIYCSLRFSSSKPASLPECEQPTEHPSSYQTQQNPYGPLWSQCFGTLPWCKRLVLISSEENTDFIALGYHIQVKTTDWIIVNGAIMMSLLLFWLKNWMPRCWHNGPLHYWDEMVELGRIFYPKWDHDLKDILLY